MSDLRGGWIRRAFQLMRWSRFAAYLMIALAGVASVIWPPASIREASDSRYLIQITWAVLMALSAFACAYGAAVDRWIGEYIGLIPLSTVAAAFGVSAMARGQVGWAGGMFLLGFFWLLISRWQEVALLRVEADRQADVRRDSDGEEAGEPPRGGGDET